MNTLYSTKPEGDIAFSKDIIKKVSERLDKDPEMVKYAFQFMFREMKLRAKREDVFAVYLGKRLGYIYYCYSYLSRLSKGALEKKHRLTRRIREKHQDGVRKAEIFSEIFAEKLSMYMAQGFFVKFRHHKGNLLNGFLRKGTMTIKDLEEIQNKSVDDGL